jgi:transcriptional regulator with XRE-family HTH domain
VTDLLLERDAARPRGAVDTDTTGGRRARWPQGWLAAGTAGHAFVVFGEPLTGPGLYWSWLARATDPLYATTDVGENHVDAVWFGGEDVYEMGYLVLPEPAVAPLLAEIVRDLREALDLPAADLAAMCGVRRRQLYNLLSGDTTSTPREEAIRVLHDIIEDLGAILDGDHDRLRAAILLPVGPAGESIYSAAIAQDVAGLRNVGQAVTDRLAAGDTRGLIRRPSPRLARFGSSRAAREFLGEYRDEREDDR